ncbi:MAG: SDR family oxidoreductase [Granulosicoccaceae bacterium]
MDNDNETQNKSRVIFVTGGASGIGASVALSAAKKDYRIAVNYNTRKEGAEKLVQTIQELGGEAMCVGGDVSDPKAVQMMFDKIENQLGPVWGLVNSAGVPNDKVPLIEQKIETLERVVRINVLGTIYPTKEAIQRMSVSRGGVGGTIVNVSSMATSIGGRHGDVPYAASKGAVDVLSMGLGREVAHDGIRVNAVRPGMTTSEMTRRLDDPAVKAMTEATIPMGRIAEAKEVAAAILWLLSDEASFVTGAILDVSGGGFKLNGE